jgi:glutathione synthase
MPRKVAFVMEGMEEAGLTNTNSVPLMEEARIRGWTVYHVDYKDITLEQNAVVAFASEINVDVSKDPFYTTKEEEKLSLETCDVIFMRQHPPFDTNYLSTLFMLEPIRKKTWIINDPFWVRNTSEKLCIFDFPEHIAPTIVSRNEKEIAAFLEAHKELVVKPLYLYGRNGVFRTSEMTPIIKALSEGNEPLMIQRFLPEINTLGNTRVEMFEGKLLGNHQVIPPQGEFAIDRFSHKREVNPLSSTQESLSHEIAQQLLKKGLTHIGIDFVGDYLIEVNVTCAGGIIPLLEVGYEGVVEQFWDLIENKF